VFFIGRWLRLYLNSVRLWDSVRFAKQHIFMREGDCGPLPRRLGDSR